MASDKFVLDCAVHGLAEISAALESGALEAPTLFEALCSGAVPNGVETVSDAVEFFGILADELSDPTNPKAALEAQGALLATLSARAVKAAASANYGKPRFRTSMKSGAVVFSTGVQRNPISAHVPVWLALFDNVPLDCNSVTAAWGAFVDLGGVEHGKRGRSETLEAFQARIPADMIGEGRAFYWPTKGASEEAEEGASEEAEQAAAPSAVEQAKAALAKAQAEASKPKPKPQRQFAAKK